ncbi:MAG TPA: hypothetical protein VNP03_20835 [Pseudonocardia sp.]|nr:hypothetical protein [Pseudonocardia sp.]
MTAAALACLALASTWQAAVLRSDDLRRQERPGGRTYRSGHGWSDQQTLMRRHRGHPAPMLASAGLLVAAGLPGRTGAAISVTCCAVIALWTARYTPTRFTSLCLTLLAAALLLDRSAVLISVIPSHAGALVASFCAAQLYLVAGIRKLRSPQFLSGRVVLDSLAYATLQASAGSRDFLPLIRPEQLSTLVVDRRVQLACRAAAVGAAAAELALGLGAVGLLPTVLTLTLAILSHVAFLLVSPVRIMPFTSAAVGLLFLATTHPIMAGIS